MCGICFSIIPKNEELPQCCWFDDTILPQLLRRGPDSFGQHEEVIPTVKGEGPSLKLFFAGTVLHLRGAVTKQPLVDENGNVLLWNGEIFDGIKVQDNENDTQVLMKSLGNCAEEADSSWHILKTLSRIRGPWSLVYWQAHQQRVWFGRDYFGRRSLLWHLPTSSNGVFSIVSVASANSSSPEKQLEWEELPADGVYCIDMSEDPIGHSVINCSLYKIRKFLWSSPDPEHHICDKETPELCSPVPPFNTAVPSDEDLNTALEDHTSKFLPLECKDKHQSTCFRDKSKDHGEVFSDKVVPSDHQKSHLLETTLDCTNSQTLHVSGEGSCNSSKEPQLANEEKHISSYEFCRKQGNSVTEKTLGKCNVSTDEGNSYFCSERTKKSHDMSELVDVECEEYEIDTPPTTWNKNNVSSADAEASGSKTKNLNGTRTHCIKGSNLTHCNPQSHVEIQTGAISSFQRSATILHDTSKSSDSRANLNDFHHSVEGCTYLEAPQELLLVLGEAVRKRVTCLPRPRDSKNEAHFNTGRTSHVGVLFSGGIDSIVIAALADRFVPPGESIDLINVAFEQKPSQVSRGKDKRKNKKQAIDKETKSIPRFDVPDRLTGRAGLKELRVLNPHRKWNFVEVDVKIDELQAMRSDYITHLVYPLETVLDDSIGCALWFAARGEGTLRCPECVDMASEGISGTCSHPAEYTCQAKVLLIGMGADEQLGGYSRHRTRFSKEGWVGLMDELQLEVKRISTRNLGRDDRCVSDHGREARFPFLDEDVVSFLNDLPVWIKTDPRLPRGTGEKILLRQAARLLGLTSSAQLPKRAIQFGSRIAKLESSGEKGSDACSRLKNKDQ